MTEGQLPRTAAREQMSLARMEMIFRVGGADNCDYYNILEWEEQTIMITLIYLEWVEQTIMITTI